MKLSFVGALFLLAILGYATSLIIPEELPTILSLIYSNIPPIKKGTDSRLGVGFRLGEHADFQILVELGPQTETEPIGNEESKRRRQVMLDSAVRGDLGPLTQAVVKYQTERRIQKELEKLKLMEEKLKRVQAKRKDENVNISAEKPQGEGANWLKKWSEQISQPD